MDIVERLGKIDISVKMWISIPGQKDRLKLYYSLGYTFIEGMYMFLWSRLNTRVTDGGVYHKRGEKKT